MAQHDKVAEPTDLEHRLPAQADADESATGIAPHSQSCKKVGLCMQSRLTSVGIQTLVASSPALQIDFSVNTVHEMLNSIELAGKPDLLIIDDLILHKLATRGAARVSSAILVVSSPESDWCSALHIAFKIGARGYCRHNVGAIQLHTAIASLLAGAAWIDGDVLRSLREYFFIQETSSCPSLALTAREAEVLGLMVRGMTNPEIARQLFVSVPTTKSHVREIFRKLNVQNRAQACSEAVRRAFV